MDDLKRNAFKMNRRGFLRTTGSLAAALAVSGFSYPPAEGAKPNIVWIMAEDLCTHRMRLYEEGGAPSPAVEAMAKSEQGIIFNNAFSNAPVCSVARSSLITGCYAPRIGTEYHRKIKVVPMPDGLEMFPAYLRKAGYHTTNSTKRDYNCVEGEGVWDNPQAAKDGWRSRKSPDTPFFHVSTYVQCHEGQLHKSVENTTADPASMKLAAVHPDTELFRKTYALHDDRVMRVDAEVEKTLSMLEKDGVLEDTFVFFFGDNGGTLPGSKGYLYETGLHVPLVVRVPENYRHLVSNDIGRRVEGVVSFVDFGPTMLNLAGIPIPEQMDGKPFLGSASAERQLRSSDEAYGSADRFDELYYTSRSLRKKNFKYIRNFEPYMPNSLRNAYRYKMAAFRQWAELYAAGKLNPAQAKFFEPKGGEELYDLDKDPWETNNLAKNPAYLSRTLELRSRLQDRTKSLPDSGIIPEFIWIEEGGAENPVKYGRENRQRIAHCLDIADLMLLPYEKAEGSIRDALAELDKVKVFWALTVCASFGVKAAGLSAIARALTKSSENIIAARAALFLALAENENPEPVFRRALASSESQGETLLILNDLTFLRDAGLGFEFNFKLSDVRNRGGDVKVRLSYLGWK